ncbi:MAG TPA: hypothetical protein ENJ82_01370, partial [Bacteroidetes bacterium]|nr:hypothetical protein [Bacteroidota bacterium]
MNLKRTTLFLVGILCFLFSKGMNQHDSANLFMESFSFEKTVIDGKFDISLNVYALDCLDWEHSFVVLPDSQQTWFGSFNVLPGPPLPTNLAYGNTVSRSVQVFYQPTLRPYHLQKLKVGLMNDRTQKLVTWEYVYIYFTPYNTVEVWNLEDFEMLKRVWSSSEGTSLQRVYVDQQGLPVSDLSDADYANDSIPKRNVLVSGLAYAVPMHAVPNGNKVNANLFSGTITGQVTADVEDDYGNNISISIWDIRVNLMENGTVIAEGYTDEDGNFSISYTDYSKSWQNIHIYLNVEGENEAGTIRLRRRIGSTRSEDLFVGSEYSHHTDDVGSHDFGTFLVDNHTVKPQLLHWANRSRQLVDSTSTFVLPGSGDRLEIMPSFVGAGQAMFMPGGYQGKLIGTVLLLGAAAGATLAPLVVAGVLAVAILVMTSNHDCIYMGSDYELSENVTYHEFGHYLMWHLQNESWAPLFEASFGHHSSTRNNKSPKLSWNEGFANGFSAIVDAWSAIDD